MKWLIFRLCVGCSERLVDEILWCATSRRQNQLPATALLIDGAAVDPVKSVRDLGIYIDSDLVMRTHVKRISIVMFCCTTPTTSDPPLGTASHVPVSGGHPGAIQAGLRKRRTGWFSGLPGTSSTVGTECGSTADLLHEIR